MAKLKDHLLPRIKEKLQSEIMDSNNDMIGLTSNPRVDTLPSDRHPRDFVLFKNERMYKHQLARFNYTTYDVRRAQDVINPDTSHCNVMVLANASEGDTTSDHPFWYARVLGIYHVNVVYTGPESCDFRPHRMDFLWVRWYQTSEAIATVQSWDTWKLDRVRFPPMRETDAFGFVDPGDVLRGCHIIPGFASGKVHIDGVGLSGCARDSQDWRHYYIGRYVSIRRFTAVYSDSCYNQIR